MPRAEDRGVLALATAARHPGVALAIANFPQQKLASAAVVLYLVMGAILAIPYVLWRKRQVNVTSSAASPRVPCAHAYVSWVAADRFA